MYMYSNSFSYSANPSVNEYLISFGQQHPVFTTDGNIKELTTEPIADIVLTKTGLEALKMLLNEIKTEP